MLSNSDNMLSCDNMCSKHIDVLTDLESKTIVALAEKGPMSGYDFHLGGKRDRGSRKALMSSGYWLKVKEHLGPEGLGFIERVNLRRYKAYDQRGRRKDLYWLTEEGIMSALLNHANLKRLRQNVKLVCGENEILQAFLDLAEVIGVDKMRRIVNLSKQYKIEAQMPDLLIVAPQTMIDNEKQFRAFVKVMKKYPKLSEIYKIKARCARSQLKRIEGYLET